VLTDPFGASIKIADFWVKTLKESHPLVTAYLLSSGRENISGGSFDGVLFKNAPFFGKNLQLYVSAFFQHAD
jgi:hypothetical protein